jgi:hypothetical protein
MRFALAVLTAALACAQQAPVNVTGTWRLNPEKTKFNGPGPKEMVITLSDEADVLRVRDVSTFDDGRQRTTNAVFRKDGTESVNQIGRTEARTTLKAEGRGYVERTVMGEMIRQSRLSLSDDGLTLTVEVSFDKGHVPVLMVFDKQADLAGKWVLNVAKSKFPGEPPEAITWQVRDGGEVWLLKQDETYAGHPARITEARIYKDGRESINQFPGATTKTQLTREGDRWRDRTVITTARGETIRDSVISVDGDVMIVDGIFYGQAGEPRIRMVFERQQ